MTDAERAELEAYKQELAAAFMARRCMACGAPAMAVQPGGAAVVEMNILLGRSVADRAWCAACWAKGIAR